MDEEPNSEKEDFREHKNGLRKKNKVERSKALTDVKGENGSEHTLECGERKRRRRVKDKEITNTEEVEGYESKDLLEGGSVSKEAKKEVKKLKSNHEDGIIQVGEVIGTHSENCKVDVEKKKRKRDKKKSIGDGAIGPHDTSSEGDVQLTKDDGRATERKKTKKPIKKENHKDDSSASQQDSVGKYDEGDVQSTEDDRHATERKKTKKPKKKENHKDDSSASQQDSVGNESNDLVKISEMEHVNQKKKKREMKNVENGSDERQDNEEVEHANHGKKRKKRLVEDDPSDATRNKCNKKVNTEERNLVRGKWFMPAEDEIVKQSVLNYIEEHELGDEGLDLVLNCKKHPNVRSCWNEIASAIPYRPRKSIYIRAQILFTRSENRKWTQEEYDAVLKYQKAYGNKWKALADELGKNALHVRNTFRRIKFPNLKKGKWSQGEYQKLFDLVNTDLQLKVSEEKRSRHGMLRDNISWSAISDKLSTRDHVRCLQKWYKQLTSPMVAEGVWANSDDYRLLAALYSLDVTCIEDVDWDDLIDNRSGDICRKRWNQMVLHIGHHGRKTFAEQVETLAHRYCPNLLEAREIWDSKPRVP